MTVLTVLAAPGNQQPEDVGKAGPLGLLLILLLLIAVFLLVRSMTTHLRRVPRSFDPDPGSDADAVAVPDTPEELFSERAPARDPGEELLDTLRRAPRAIEPPRGDGRPADPDARS